MERWRVFVDFECMGEVNLLNLNCITLGVSKVRRKKGQHFQYSKKDPSATLFSKNTILYINYLKFYKLQ